MCNRWKLLIKFLKFKLKWRTILRKKLEKNILHQMFLFISNLRFETMHQTSSKLSRCLKQIKLQIMEHLRETMHCNVAKVFLDAHLNSFKAWISSWIFLKLLMGPALVTISWNQVCMYELIGDFRKIFNPLCICNPYASYHLTLLHSQ